MQINRIVERIPLWEPQLKSHLNLRTLLGSFKPRRPTDSLPPFSMKAPKVHYDDEIFKEEKKEQGDINWTSLPLIRGPQL